MREILKDKITVGRAAEILGLHESRVRVLADTGRIPGVRGPWGMRFLDRAAVESMAAYRAKNGSVPKVVRA